MEISQEVKTWVHEHRNEIKNCPVCNGNIQDRTISIYAGLIRSLYNVYRWCGANKKHEFKMKDIKNILSKNDYARFSDLKRFGGIVYEPENNDPKNGGNYGINMGRAKAFFRGEYKIPVQIVIDQITNKRVAATYISIHEIPELRQMLSIEGVYDYESTYKIHVDFRKQEERGIPSVEDYFNNKTLF